MRKKIPLILLAIVIFGIGIAFLFNKKQDPVDRVSTGTTNAAEEQHADNNSIRIVAAGDNIPHDTLNARAKTGSGYDYTSYFNNVLPIMKTADIMFCNQESPSAGDTLGVSGYPSFNAPSDFSKSLQKVGCNVINLANNHAADRGTAGIDATIDVWDNLKPLAHSGTAKDQAGQNTVSYFTVKNKKFAILSFTDLSNNTDIPGYALNFFSDTLINTLVGEANKNADYVIISAHWGTEDSPEATSSQQSWAQKLANAGADLVIGTGPHVLGPVDTLTGAGGTKVPVYYSIGNMLTTQLKLEELIGGFAVIDLDTSGDQIALKELSFVPTYMHYEWSGADEAAENLLARDNIMIYPLDTAADALSKTRFGTSVDEQTNRVTNLLNSNIPVTIKSSKDF